MYGISLLLRRTLRPSGRSLASVRLNNCVVGCVLRRLAICIYIVHGLVERNMLSRHLEVDYRPHLCAAVRTDSHRHRNVRTCHSKFVLLQFSQCCTPNKAISFCSEQRRHVNNRTQFRMLTVHFCTSVSIYTEHPSLIRTRLPYLISSSRFLVISP